MHQQKNNTSGQRRLFFSLLFILPVIFIGIMALLITAGESKATSTQTSGTGCTTTYGEWSTCSSSGKQERTNVRYCTGLEPYSYTEQQTCAYVPTYFPCTSYTYSAWSTTCQDGYYTRSVIAGLPTGCLATMSGSATPDTKKACPSTTTTYAECTSFSYSDWGACTTIGTQTRDVTASNPTGCSGGNPDIKRSCTYTATTPSSGGTAGSTSDSTTYNSISGQSTATTPEFNFLEIGDDAFLSGRYSIKGKVDSARGVEFYLIPLGSNTYKYMGSASNSTMSYWELPFDTTTFPNGSFYLTAKIRNNYGMYEASRKIRVNISNEFSTVSSVENKETGAIGSSQNSGEIDSDNDGLSDEDEFRYKTDPKNPDTDGDGFLDGDEVKNGFNPLQFSPGDRSDKIVFESPKETGEVKKDLYRVSNVEVVAVEEGKKELRLTGKALPNSFVNIYIYSDLPIILTVKTDSEGNWSYVLDKQLEDGEHQVYVAVTDNTGKITAKSDPLFFVKTAEAATVIPPAEASALAKSAAPAEKRRTKDLMVLAGIIILGFIAALTAIGFYIIHANKKNKGIA